eukprot:scaffold1555_cov116-Alexandrium_tamarense.AAC.3
MKFGTPATQALIAFASVALLSSLRTASAQICENPTTPTDNEGAVLVRFWDEFGHESREIGADCPFECVDANDMAFDVYVALDETEDKSDCKVRPLPLARGISTSCSLPLMLTASRSGSDSNLVPMSTKGGTCGGDADSFSVDMWLGTCACEGEDSYQGMISYASKCVVVENSSGHRCSKIIDYSACEVTTTTTTSTTTTTPEPKFWPDWLGDDTCVFSEKYPQYMQLNPTWTGSTLEDCCKRYYSWRYDDCLVEGGGTSTAANTATLYYPDWYVDVEQDSGTVSGRE